MRINPDLFRRTHANGNGGDAEVSGNRWSGGHHAGFVRADRSGTLHAGNICDGAGRGDDVDVAQQRDRGTTIPYRSGGLEKIKNEKLDEAMSGLTTNCF